ncbi:ABC TRANSPORTER [Encephalitozoon cuniculi GB-M1]|uniref:ABC TRANSPORTER n=2 Tax=Encephalitozoon cuniculi TaxID=6035 RepID=Q8SSB8_ENCCU|nr:ABCG-like transporter [Encephalitozoon cuniculi GB-M1]AGE95925.1 ABC transporter [Encephalitozoon cuniculi]KMV66403.1 ABCG-like transporter [Encephalitozoon cuniculi EcunIII-L]UYI28030.1 ABC transporter [Encephalitozoon cuniculi]CAD26185.1 ABC TRANSPORTER [Encephalitozoon cuniculi GB-M1]
MKLESQKSELLWRNLRLTTKGADGAWRTILRGVSGVIEPSTMTALMGTSGAGKTTLMNALAGRISPNMHLKGEILLNSHPRSKDTWPEIVGYVEQEFHAYEYQTVFETLSFASKIKMRGEEMEQKVVNRIEEIVSLLGLKNAKNTYIANLSGGERKRVSIGVELLGNPSILFCDEPTSGLDSFNALNILSLLRDLSNMGKTVLVTIHQPSYEMINFFDKFILMSMGKVIYDGDVKGCIGFFARCGHRLPEFTNPVDFFLKTISLDTRTKSSEEKSLDVINHISAKWRRERKEVVPKLSSEVRMRDKTIKTTLSFFLLWSRNLKNYLRNSEYFKIKAFQKMFFITVFGLAYLRMGYSVESIYTRLGGITFILTNMLFGVCNPIFNVFSSEKMVILRERRSGMYSGFMAFIAKYFSEIFINFMLEIPYLVIIYWTIGLNPDVRVFLVFMAIIISLILLSIAYSLAISTMTSTQNNSQVLGSMGLLVFLIYSGSFNNPNTISKWLKWIVWISPMYYATKASFQNQLNGVVFKSPNVQTTGEEQIKSRGLDGMGVWPCVFVLLGMTLLWMLSGATVLHWTTKNNMKVEINDEEV